MPGRKRSSAWRWRPPPTASTGRSMPSRRRPCGRGAARRTHDEPNHDNPTNRGSGIMKLHALGRSMLTAGAMALAVFLGSGQARAADPIIIGAAIALSGPIAPYDEG